MEFMTVSEILNDLASSESVIKKNKEEKVNYLKNCMIDKKELKFKYKEIDKIRNIHYINKYIGYINNIYDNYIVVKTNKGYNVCFQLSDIYANKISILEN